MDRNTSPPSISCMILMSLSARRAWIEITVVAVLATLVTASLSARRAWIEIQKPFVAFQPISSLSARRAWIEIGKSTTLTRIAWGRSPQGERG